MLEAVHLDQAHAALTVTRNRDTGRPYLWVLAQPIPTNHTGVEVTIEANRRTPDLPPWSCLSVGAWCDHDVDGDDHTNHADQCRCGDWEDGGIDQRCADRNGLTFEPAVLRDEGAHGLSLVSLLKPGPVGTAHITECVPIVEIGTATNTRRVEMSGRHATIEGPAPDGGQPAGTNISDQLLFGNFAPERFAWILTNATPANPCPHCVDDNDPDCGGCNGTGVS